MFPPWDLLRSGRLNNLDESFERLDVEDLEDLPDLPNVRVFIRPVGAPGLGMPGPDNPGGKTALRVAMDKAGYGCWVMQRLSGVSHGTINNLANGKGGVERRKADAIAAALGMSTAMLFHHGDGVPPA